MPLNAAWHQKHPMPKNPTVDERVAWHLAHARHCACRPIPEKLKREIDARSGGRRPVGG